MISRSATRQKSLPVRPGRTKIRGRKAPAIDHAVQLIHRVCCLAGSADLMDEVRDEDGGSSITASIRNGVTPALFDWLVASLGYQGISDQVAEAYMERYGSATWADIRAKLVQGAPCPKVKSYWHFQGCRYDKVSGTVRSRITSRRARCRPIIAERPAQPDGLFPVLFIEILPMATWSAGRQPPSSGR